MAKGIEWNDAGMAGIASDGSVFYLQSEHVQGEKRVWYPMFLHHRETEECPYGCTGTKRDAQRVCEWVYAKRQAAAVPGEDGDHRG